MRTSAIIVLAVLLVSTSVAEAITITRAEVRNGLAVVEGNKATKSHHSSGKWQCWADE